MTSGDPKHIYSGVLSCLQQYYSVSISIWNLKCVAPPIPKICLELQNLKYRSRDPDHENYRAVCYPKAQANKLMSLTPPNTKIWKTIQNFENGMIWG